MSPEIHPTSIVLNCTLGNNISIGPFCFISDSTVEDGVSIEGNVRIEKSVIHEKSELLWWSLIRWSEIGSESVIGCEVKKSILGHKNKAKHPGTNIVSATTGEKVNFGGGFKCANYDGTGKGTFIIGSNVFFGCNTVISVKAWQTTHIHDGTKIGANIHINHDIPADSLVYIDKETAKITVREGYYKK